MADISQVKNVFGCIVAVANAEEKLRKIDFSLALNQLRDADEAGLKELADFAKNLDLNDDNLEAVIEAAIDNAVAPAAFILRLLKIVFPHKPNP